jgi:hypothetical protein
MRRVVEFLMAVAVAGMADKMTYICIVKSTFEGIFAVVP